MDRDFDLSAQYPIFGPEIECPHCRQMIPALTLTDSYLCSRHGAFEANPDTTDLVHVPSGRCWRYWDGQWYRQHTHPDGIRFEIHEALDRLYTQGYRATRVTIAARYKSLIVSYLDRGVSRHNPDDSSPLKLYGLPIHFSPSAETEPCWGTINFDLDKEPGAPVRQSYFQVLE